MHSLTQVEKKKVPGRRVTHRGRAVKEVSVQGDQPRVEGTTTDNALGGGKGVAGGEQLGGLGGSR